jgi:predicted restriction endonuclease
VRELSPGSARLLDELLDAPGTPRGEEALGRGWDEALTEGPLDPDTLEDERRRTLASVVQRQGQEDFRGALLLAHKGRCAISGCDVEPALQAAHIIPYLGPHSNRCSNGLLLRADLHNPFDLGLLTIDPERLTVGLAPSLTGSCYAHLNGVRLTLPDSPADRPSREALNHRLESHERILMVPRE